MAKNKSRTDLFVDNQPFDYSPLTVEVADDVRGTAERIRQRLKKALEDIIEVGNDLLTVKAALPHGQFGFWLRAEFGWSERMAQNFMRVAERFGSKTEIIADLAIQPTAAYLLAAPSIPDEARELAIQRAEQGDRITTAVAKKIVGELRKQRTPKKKTPLPAEKLTPRLLRVLGGYRERWDPDQLSELARQLHEFADQLESSPRTTKRRKR